jgi:hypothetical protein
MIQSLADDLLTVKVIAVPVPKLTPVVPKPPTAPRYWPNEQHPALPAVHVTLSVIDDCALALATPNNEPPLVFSVAICGKLADPLPMSGLLDQLVVLAPLALPKKATLSPAFVAVILIVMLLALALEP